jgi:hypothetical protein
VSIDPDRVLRVNGSRFFPIGLLELGIDRYPADWNQRIRDSGANFIWDNGFAYSDSTPACEAIRDSSNAAGYYVLVGSPATWEWDDPDTPEPEVEQPLYEAGELQSVNVCFPYWSLHLGYVNRDEPEWTIPRGVVGNVDSTHVHDTYAQIRAAEPFKIVAINFGNAHLTGDLDQWKADVSGFLPAADVVMSTNYPYPAGPGTCGPYNVWGPGCSLDRLWQAADVFRTELAPAKPLWMILQAHKGIPRKEARWAATQSIIHGATGLLWAGWTWYHPLGDGEPNWPTMREVISEFTALDEALTQPDVPSVTSLEPDVDVLGKVDPSDELLVFAASRNGFRGEAAIRMPGVAGHWVEVLHENRWLPIEDDEIVDFFDGYQSHIYQVQSIGFQPPVDAPFVAGEPATALRLVVFPNPAQGVVAARLSAPAVEGAAVTVHDVTGRRVGRAEVLSQGPHAARVAWDAREAGALPGLYFLRARTADGGATTARAVLR